MPSRLALPLVEIANTRSRFRIEVAQNCHAMTSEALQHKPASTSSKSKIFIGRPLGGPASGAIRDGFRATARYFVQPGGNRHARSTFQALSELCSDRCIVVESLNCGGNG
jgi:hypothetical protein